MSGASSNNNPGAFIGAIKLLNVEDKQSQLFAYITKSCEEFLANENLNAINKILAELNPAQHPIAAFAVMSAKFQLSSKYNVDELRVTLTKLKSMTTALNVSYTDQNFCTVYFFTLKSAADACLFKKVPMLGISTLIDAIQWYTNGHPEVLTPAHASLLCLCLKARHFYLCDPFINIDPEALLQQGLEYRRAGKQVTPLIACGSEPILLFFYYSALIRVAQCRYKEGLLLLEQLLCMRGICNSAIATAGFKVAVVVALILGHDQLFLPGCRILKFLTTSSRAYLALAYVVCSANIKDNIPALVKEYAEKNRKHFTHDGNFGLIEVLVRKLQEKKIMDMPKTFVTIDRRRAMARTYFNTNESFDNIVRKLISSGELKCSIDDQADVFQFRHVPKFEESVEEETDDQPDMDEQLRDIAVLTKNVRNIYDRLKVVPHPGNVTKTSKKRAVKY